MSLKPGRLNALVTITIMLGAINYNIIDFISASTTAVFNFYFYDTDTLTSSNRQPCVVLCS